MTPKANPHMAGARIAEPLHALQSPANGEHLSRLDIEAEHHSALVMLGNVAVSHPSARIRDIEEDVDGFPGADENGVFPDEVRLIDAVAARTRKRPAP